MDAIPVSPPAAEPIHLIEDDPPKIAENPGEERVSWRFPIAAALAAIAMIAAAHRFAPPPDLPDGSRPPPAPDPFAAINAAPPGDYPSMIVLPPPVAPPPRAAARVSNESPLISGRLPPEVVMRILRMNRGRFRVCYEEGLRRNPNLMGSVTARFVIGQDGSVTAVANGGTDLPDAGVVSCVLGAVNRLSFPQPESGIAVVKHTLRFHPG